MKLWWEVVNDIAADCADIEWYFYNCRVDVAANYRSRGYIAEAAWCAYAGYK